MATVWPGLRLEGERLDERLLGVVAERHVVEAHVAVGACRQLGRGLVGACSSASRSSNVRSAEATPDCSMFAMPAIWPSGCENSREYWMNAVASPRVIWPEATRRPPTTAMST